MRVILGIPFRDSGDRGVAYRKTQSELFKMWDWDDVFTVDSGHDPFNRAASRNLIVQKALDASADVVVICDADSIPEPVPLEKSILEANTDGRLHIPFDKVRVVAGKHAYAENDRYKRAVAIYSYGPSCGGVFVIRPSQWAHLGGMDERIVGWGYEDQIFLVATNTFGDGYIRHSGVLHNFQHKRAEESDFSVANGRLRDLYNQNQGNQELIRDIQRGSNHFCP